VGQGQALSDRQPADAVSDATAKGDLFKDRAISEAEFEALHVWRRGGR